MRTSPDATIIGLTLISSARLLNSSCDITRLGSLSCDGRQSNAAVALASEKEMYFSNLCCQFWSYHIVNDKEQSHF